MRTSGTTLRILLLGILIPVVSFSLSAQLKIVKTVNGKVEGYQSGDIAIFKGIPFAAPPVGELRWKAPQPVKNWSGVLKCTEFSASPMQSKPVPFMMWTEEFIAPPDKLSEDCLYLNVWTPARSAKANLPVFVWIYGGAFTSGSAACPVYDGEEMARQGVIFVSFNYRVGVFGFLALPELSKESPDKVSGNYGLLDQVAALKWVKQNIAAFGGDPEKVTIAGQSAGSISVGAMVLSPLAKGLFRGAITQSGGFIGLQMLLTLQEEEKNGQGVMNKVKASSLSDLRKKSAEELIAAGGRMGPLLDGYVLPVNPLDAAENGQFNQVPMIAGWVTGDGSLMGVPTLTPEKYKEIVKSRYGDHSGEFLQLFPGNNAEQVIASIKEMNLLRFAAFPANLLALFDPKPTYMYQFSHVPVDKPDFPNYGAFHSSEVPFALHTLAQWKRPWRKIDYEVEKTMNSYWVNFVKTGNPNGSGLPDWRKYDKETGNILEIGDQVNLIPALYSKKMNFLDSLNRLEK